MPCSVHLLEVSIEKFRSIQEPLHLKLEKPSGGPLSRVVLAGPNGAGKTSVVEGILLGLGFEDLIVRDLPAAERGDHWRIEIPQGGVIELQCRMVAGQYFFEPPFDPRTKHFTVRRTADEWTICWHADDEVGSISDPTRVRSLLKEMAVEYFSSWRAPILPGGIQPSGKGRPLHDNEANRLRRLKQRIINERALRAFEPEASGAQDEVWLARLNEVWSAFHRDGSYLDPGVLVNGETERLFDLFVLEKDGTRRCSIDQLSSGEIELLSMGGTLILGAFHGLLLIDEPELHLHREWQGQLMDVLSTMAPNAQLIVATHADAPWDQVYSFERFFLARPDDPRFVSQDTNSMRSDD